MISLWIEHAHQSLAAAGAQVCGDAVSTFQNKERFFSVVASRTCSVQGSAARVAGQLAGRLEGGAPPEQAVRDSLAVWLGGGRLSFSIVHVQPAPNAGRLTLRAQLFECDAPPLFWVRGGELVLPPVVEEELHGRLVRTCTLDLHDGDHVALVSEGYVQAGGWSKQGGWRGIALAVKRLTATRCDAEQLLGALVRSYQRLAAGEPAQDVSVAAMAVRPLRSVTLWSGPPLERRVEKNVLEKLMAEPGQRVICGDTTAGIAARLLGARLEMDPRPEDGWAEVPPTSRLAGVDLVTEGLVTMRKARERMTGVKNARGLPRQADGATRLARILLNADQVHFLVGLAVNPVQAADPAKTLPMRRSVIDELINELRARGKIVETEYF